MNASQILLADASVLLAVLAALFAASAWGVRTWIGVSTDALRSFHFGWIWLTVGLLSAALYVPATSQQLTGWSVVLAGLANTGFLLNAGFMLGAVRRVATRGPFPYGPLRAWVVAYFITGFAAASLKLGGERFADAESGARMLVFFYCAGLFTASAWEAWRYLTAARGARWLLSLGSLGCTASHVLLAASLPSIEPGVPTADGALLLPAVALASFMTLGLGMLMHVVDARREADAEVRASLTVATARASTVSGQLDAALGAIGDGAVLLGLDLTLRAWNAPFEAMSKGAGVVPTVGMPCRAMMTDDAKPQWESAWREIAQGRPAQFRLARSFGGVRRVVDVRASPCHGAHGIEGGVAVLRDITDLVELEARFHHAQRAEAVGRLAHGVAHDFNNLLSAIGLTIEMGAEDGDTEAAFRDLRTIADRGRELTARLLDMARQRTEGEDETFVVAERVEGLAGVLRRLLGASVRLEVAVEDQALAVRMGTGHFEQVLLNLVVNARDAMPDGGLIRVQVRGMGTGDDARVEVRVRDTGVGMPPDVIARALEPYFTTKGEGKGTGLGLSTCRDLVQQAGGDLAIESRVGEGTTIIVGLPAVSRPSTSGSPGPVVTTPRDGMPAVSPDVVGPADGPLAIVADDDPLVLRSVVRALVRNGYRVLPCPDGHAALHAVRAASGGVQLVVSDVLMPRMDGPAWVRTARAQGCAAPVLFMSGYADTRLDETVLRDLQATMLAKPFTADQLHHALGHLVVA